MVGTHFQSQPCKGRTAITPHFGGLEKKEAMLRAPELLFDASLFDAFDFELLDECECK
jgi:hypothetical protein